MTKAEEEIATKTPSHKGVTKFTRPLEGGPAGPQGSPFRLNPL